MEWFREWLGGIGVFLKTGVLPLVTFAVAGFLLVRLLLRLMQKALSRTKLEYTAQKLISTVAKAVLYGLLFLVVASRLGIDVTGIVALASVLTLAISLAVQNMLTNVISGFTLLYTKPFHTDDYVEMAGQSGTVKSIGLTYTELTTPDNKNVFIPNSVVTASEIVNYTVLGIRRVEITVCASYASPIDTVLEALAEAAQVDTLLQDKPPFVALQAYEESSVSYIVHAWTAAEDYWTTLFSINKRIKKAFDARNIAMPCPHLNVHMD